MNAIRLLRGECRATNEELKKFQKEKGRLFSRLFLCVFVIVLYTTCLQVVYSFVANLLSFCYHSVSKV